MALPIKTIPSEFHIPDKRLSKIKYDLPLIPSNMLFAGRVGSGKSSIMWSMLSNGYMVKGKSVFDEIVIYCSTGDSKETWLSIPCKNIVFKTEYNADEFKEYLDDLRQHQLEREKKKKRRLNCLCLFDDMASDQLVKPLRGQASPLEKLLLTSRHELNMSVMFATQTFRSKGFTTPTVRNNLNYIFVLSMAKNNVEKIGEEYGENLTKDQFLDLYYHIHRKPYQFLLIDNKKKCFRNGFTDIIMDFSEKVTDDDFKKLLSDNNVDEEEEHKKE